VKASSSDSQGYYELKQHKLWFGTQCPKLLDQSKYDKLKWLQNQSQTMKITWTIYDVELIDLPQTSKGGVSERRN
jgi:hypothetical protein